MGHVVRGGVAGAGFSLDELERAAALLGRSAADLGAAADCLDGSLAALGRLLVSADAAVAVWSEAGLRRASVSVRAVHLRVGVLGAGVLHARRIYEETEARVLRTVHAARAAVLPLIVAHDLATNAVRPRAATTQDLVNQSPALAGALLPLLFPASYPVASRLGAFRDRAHGGVFDTTVAERLYPRLAGVATRLEWVEVAPIEISVVAPARRVPFAGTVDGLMALQRAAEPPESGAGALLVTTVDTPSGPVHVLTLPGTQLRHGDAPGSVPGPGAAPHANPWDAGGIVEGMGLGSQHVAAAALEALERVGAKSGDRLVLAGYSQGGIHAANLAADPRLAAAFDVEQVFTVGSPVGNMDLPAGVRAFHVEHVDDPVPGTEGATNPDTRNRVTVYLDGYGGGVDRGQGGFGAAHDLQNYSAELSALRASTDPALVEAGAALGAVFAGATAATTRTVSLRRTGASAAGAPRATRARGAASP
ncbi:hypothetical protein ACX8Z9_04075 [Arthrobacter halodurans]|uniref:PE-PPE domain-containing protein n=1 Tax=Arthrobacter halodurans TaxID=516699 RepID=A0ABV4UKX2_9MICC